MEESMVFFMHPTPSPRCMPPIHIWAYKSCDISAFSFFFFLHKLNSLFCASAQGQRNTTIVTTIPIFLRYHFHILCTILERTGFTLPRKRSQKWRIPSCDTLFRLSIACSHFVTSLNIVPSYTILFNREVQEIVLAWKFVERDLIAHARIILLEQTVLLTLF